MPRPRAKATAVAETTDAPAPTPLPSPAKGKKGKKQQQQQQHPVKKSIAKKERVKVNYHVLLPKTNVRALALKRFPGSIGAMSVVGLTALTEQFFGLLHRRSCRQLLAKFLADLAHKKEVGKFMGEDKPRVPYTEKELPGGFKVTATHLREVINIRQTRSNNIDC